MTIDIKKIKDQARQEGIEQALNWAMEVIAKNEESSTFSGTGLNRSICDEYKRCIKKLKLKSET